MIRGIYNENCISCGHCMRVGSVGAVQGDLEGCGQGKDTKKINRISFEDFIIFRRSVRVYDKKEVEKDKLQKIINEAAHAPTACNSQDVRYVVIGARGVLKLEKMAGEYYIKNPDLLAGRLARETGYKILMDAPVVVGICSKKGSGLMDCDFAAHNLVLAAHSLGIGTCYNGIFTRAYQADTNISGYLELDHGYEVKIFTCMGYPVKEINYKYIIKRKKPEVLWKE